MRGHSMNCTGSGRKNSNVEQGHIEEFVSGDKKRRQSTTDRRQAKTGSC